jgi:hypothetical protein
VETVYWLRSILDDLSGGVGGSSGRSAGVGAGGGTSGAERFANSGRR